MTSDERIEKIERQLAHVRWFNRALIACIVLSLGLWFILRAFGPVTAWARALQAGSFALVDENGKQCGVLGHVGDKGPSLMLMDENGGIHAMLGQTADGLGLEFWDENRVLRVSLTVNKNGPILLLLDENGKPIWSAPERAGVIPIK